MLIFLGLPGPDLLGQMVINGNFETPSLGANTFSSPSPATGTWTFSPDTNHAGIASFPTEGFAPVGGASGQYAYLHRAGGSMSQVLTFGSAGSFILTYLEAARQNNNEGDVLYTVSLADAHTLSQVFSANDTAPLGEGYTLTSYAMTVPSAGDYILQFEVTGVTNGSDYTAIFDNVAVTSAVPEPSTYAALAGLAVLGGAWTKRRRRAHG